MCIWWTDYEKYAPFYPLVCVLASFLACLATQLIISLLVYSIYACNAYQLWMNFKVMFCWFMIIILCISVLLYLWFSSYLAYECIPFCHQNFTTRKTFQKTLKPSFVWLNIWDCVGLFLCSLETISGTNSYQNLIEFMVST